MPNVHEPDPLEQLRRWTLLDEKAEKVSAKIIEATGDNLPGKVLAGYVKLMIKCDPRVY